MTSSATVIKKSPPVLIIIGVHGGGKTSDAKLIAKEIGGIFYDGDDAISKESWMHWQIERGLPVKKSQVEDYMENHLIPALIQQKKSAHAENKPLIVSQALFFNKHRFEIERQLGGDVHFGVINTDSKLQKQQIRARCAAQDKSSVRTWLEVKSALKSNPHFEKPKEHLKSF